MGKDIIEITPLPTANVYIGDYSDKKVSLVSHGWGFPDNLFDHNSISEKTASLKCIFASQPPVIIPVGGISKKYIPLRERLFMKNLSLKLDDEIFAETEKVLQKVKKNRNRYINEAVKFYNRLHKRRLLSKQLNKASGIVSRDSMEVLAEFERLQDDYDS